MQGIVVGTDRNQEWMLPWWWDRYSRHNTWPVVFFDFGMSQRARKWCAERGKVIPLLNGVRPAPQSQIPAVALKGWMEHHDERIWTARPSWFRKPRAMLRSPFEKSIWIDLDCEILGDLTPLFAYGPFAAAKEMGRAGVNAGVIVFEKNHSLLEKWAALCDEKSHTFPGDQDVLNHLLKRKKISILPQIYNWRMQLGENPEAVIMHWIGPLGKEIIRHLA